MTNKELFQEINSLPPEGQRLVESFLAFSRQRYASSVVSSSGALWQDEKFIGTWQDREELPHSTAWVRGIRQ